MTKRESLIFSLLVSSFVFLGSCASKANGSSAANEIRPAQKSQAESNISKASTGAKKVETKSTKSSPQLGKGVKEATAKDRPVLAPPVVPPATGSPELPRTDAPSKLSETAATTSQEAAIEEPPMAVQASDSSPVKTPAAEPVAKSEEPAMRAEEIPAAAAPTPSSAPSATPSPEAPRKAIASVPAISGEMKISFGTRKDIDEKGMPNPGAEDRYEVDLSLLGKTHVKGSVTRRPRLLSSILGREVQAGELKYDLRFSEGDKLVGKLTGSVPVDASGTLDFSRGSLKIENGEGKQSRFTGRIVGRAEKSAGLSEKLIEYTRIFNKKKVTLQVKHIDPLLFENLHIPALGSVMPEVSVSGRFDYDYDTGNWLSNGFRFKQTAYGEKRQDDISGSIHWVEDPSRDYNGKGYYEFNLRYNEATKDESAFFDESGDETQFFAVADDVPGLVGKVSYRDTFGSSKDRDGERPVLASVITYDVRANELSAEQAANFFRLWLLIVGPVNDE